MCVYVCGLSPGRCAPYAHPHAPARCCHNSATPNILCVNAAAGGVLFVACVKCVVLVGGAPCRILTLKLTAITRHPFNTRDCKSCAAFFRFFTPFNVCLHEAVWGHLSPHADTAVYPKRCKYVPDVGTGSCMQPEGDDCRVAWKCVCVCMQKVLGSEQLADLKSAPSQKGSAL